MENTHARLVDKGTEGALAQSQEIQLKAILARFGGDRKAAADYCWLTAATSTAVMGDYLDYFHILGQAVAA
jgi:transcriptional regulator with AAA-type ATPase domain